MKIFFQRLAAWATLVVLALGAGAPSSHAAPARRVAILGQAPCAGVYVRTDFVAGVYCLNGVQYPSFAEMPGATFTRASAGTAANGAGQVIAFASGVPRITDLGILIEEARTNVALWSRDLTNAAWTKSNVAAALNQTGADGAANAASSITATGGNGTVLQAITLGSSARFQTAYVKRIAGSGTINMTMDNGATWTAIAVTSSWSRVSIPTQTLANPTVGFRIVTSGDAIAVDYVQNENSGAFATSPIATTSASAARAADLGALNGLTGLATPSSIVAWGSIPNADTTRFVLASLSDGVGVPNRLEPMRDGDGKAYGGGNSGAVVEGGARLLKIGSSAAVGPSFHTIIDGVVGAPDGSNAVPTSLTLLRLGTLFSIATPLDGYLQRVLVYNSTLTDAQLQSLTN
jgi:hypothetical protein